MLYTDLVLGAKQHAFSKVTFQQILENTLLFKFSRSLSEIRRQFVRKKNYLTVKNVGLLLMATTSHCLSLSSEEFLN